MDVAVTTVVSDEFEEEEGTVKIEAREKTAWQLGIEIDTLWAELHKLKDADKIFGGFNTNRMRISSRLASLAVVRNEKVKEDREAGRNADAHIEITSTENERGYMQDCVFVYCNKEGVEAGPIWGTGDRSIARALIRLTEICECGAQRHNEEESAPLPSAFL